MTVYNAAEDSGILLSLRQRTKLSHSTVQGDQGEYHSPYEMMSGSNEMFSSGSYSPPARPTGLNNQLGHHVLLSQHLVLHGQCLVLLSQRMVLLSQRSLA